MPSPFSNGVQNADKVFDLFAEGQVTLFTVGLTTGSTAVGTAHGVGAAPDFVLLQSSVAADIDVDTGLIYSAGATTLTITRQTTGAAATISVIAGNLS